jgi:tRNA pseudouridine55 synthase
MQAVDKEYLATVRLGRTTDSYDRDGQVVHERPIPALSREETEEVLSEFRGEVTQMPPMFSAVKVGGERLYKAARRGETRERPPRVVTIYELVLLDQRAGSWQIKVRCSSGTYIRSLAHDLGERFGCGAYLEQLRRTRSGEFDLSSTIQLDEVESSWKRALIPIDGLLSHIPIVNVDENGVQGIIHGNSYLHSEAVETEYCRLFYRDLLLAIGKADGPLIQPEVVLRTDFLTT